MYVSNDPQEDNLQTFNTRPPNSYVGAGRLGGVENILGPVWHCCSVNFIYLFIYYLLFFCNCIISLKLLCLEVSRCLVIFFFSKLL